MWQLALSNCGVGHKKSCINTCCFGVGVWGQFGKGCATIEGVAIVVQPHNALDIVGLHRCHANCVLHVGQLAPSASMMAMLPTKHG